MRGVGRGMTSYLKDTLMIFHENVWRKKKSCVKGGGLELKKMEEEEGYMYLDQILPSSGM